MLCDHGHDHGHIEDIRMTKIIKASEFKAKCLALMDEVERTGQGVVITKNGKPVAELVPHRRRKKNARGILKDSLFITGDTSFRRSMSSGTRSSDPARYPCGDLVHARRPCAWQENAEGRARGA
jgi:prevent-host-death family protein